jgi:drug/metabolite transporter (DMT)-like permease
MTISQNRDIGLFFVIVVLFGAAFPAIKMGVEYFPPLLLAAARYYLSALLLLTYAALTRPYWKPRVATDWKAIGAGGVLFIGGTGLSFVGIQYTTSGVAAIIFSLIPVLTVLIGWLLLPTERLSRRGIVGVLVGFGGVALVIRPHPSALTDTVIFGNTLVLLAAVSVTLGTVLVRRVHPPMSIIAVTGWSMLVGGTVQLAFSLGLGESLTSIRLTVTAVLILGYLSILAGGLGFVIYFDLLDRVGVLEVNLVTYLNPIVALFIGWIVLEEPIVIVGIAGLLVVFVGFALVKNKELTAELAKYRGAAR